jgi:hypothetical protein
MRRVASTALVLLIAALGAGCGSTQVSTDAATSTQPVASPADTTTSVSTTPSPPTYPLVQFTMTMSYPEGTWPFTAQLTSITKNPGGFANGGDEPPGDTYLMVQVNITSETTGRAVPPPQLGNLIVCRGPGSRTWKATFEGYDEGPDTDPDSTGSHVALGTGEPHAWDVEWVVPESLDISRVKCRFGRDLEDRQIAQTWIEAAGPTRLN